MHMYMYAHTNTRVCVCIRIRYLLKEPSASLVDFLLTVLEYSFFQELDKPNYYYFFFI